MRIFDIIQRFVTFFEASKHTVSCSEEGVYLLQLPFQPALTWSCASIHLCVHFNLHNVASLHWSYYNLELICVYTLQTGYTGYNARDVLHLCTLTLCSVLCRVLYDTNSNSVSDTHSSCFQTFRGDSRICSWGRH